MRLSFVDYLGTYVEHCHRLPHEDRGMMSMVRTIPHDPIVAVAVPGSPGVSSTVVVARADDQEVLTTLTPFPGFEGSLFTAVGDVDGDALPDVAVASGDGKVTEIIVYSNKTMFAAPVLHFEGLAPFGAATNGASVALADIDADHLDDLIVGEGAGGKGRVAVFDATTGAELDRFSPYGEAYGGSVGVAAGMVEEGGRISLFTAPGAGRAAEVKMFNYDLFGNADGTLFPDLHASLQSLRREVATFDGAEQPGYEGGLSIAIGYPRARWGGFANVITSTLTGEAEVRLFAIAAHDHGGGMVSATGVHKAVAYSPDAERMATRVAKTTLDDQTTGFEAGASVGVFSTVDGAVVLAVRPDGTGPVVKWKIADDGTALQSDGLLGALGGSFVSGM
jgi:hypothetical protein